MGLFDDILKGLPENAVLRGKVREAEAENAALKDEIATLKDEKRQLQTENKRLKEQIESFAHTDDLHESEIKILNYLADSNTPNFHDSIMINLNLDETHLDYYLTILREHNYISWTGGSVVGEALKYVLTQKGREFLIKN